METQPIRGTKKNRRALPDIVLPIAEHSPFPMVMVEEPAHNIRYVNDAFCRLVDKSRENLLGEPFGRMFPHMSKQVAMLDRVFLTGKPENHTEQKDAGSVTHSCSYTVWPIVVDEHCKGMLIQVTDIPELHQKTLAMNEALMLSSLRQHELTAAAGLSNVKLQEEINERKQLEESLQAAVSELRATNDQLETFVYSIAHDLRAPLRSMQGFSTLLVEEVGPALSPIGYDYARRIDKSAQFMDALLSDLLAFSRLNQQHVILAPVKVGTAVDSALAQLQSVIQEKNAQIKTPASWPVVRAHGPTLAQVLLNLIGHALKFVVAGARPIVGLRIEERGEMVRIWVEDNGPGIASQHHGEIFKLFTRLDGEKYPGTGLGLAIVQKGVERMGGRAGVESAPGQGSQFWFELLKG